MFYKNTKTKYLVYFVFCVLIKKFQIVNSEGIVKNITM